MIEEENAQADKNSPEKMKEDNAWDQRVLEAPRAEENKESIVEMVRQLDQQFDKLTTKFQASMAAIDEELATATDIAAEQDLRGSPTATMSATAMAMATHMQWRCQFEANMTEKSMKHVERKVRMGRSSKEAVIDTFITTAAIPTMAVTAVNATTATAATAAVSSTATGGAGRTSEESAADAKIVSKAEPPPLAPPPAVATPSSLPPGTPRG